MTAPAPLEVTVQEVADYLGSTVEDEPGLALAVAGVNAMVGDWLTGRTTTERHHYGAVRLAGAIVRARNSPAGVEEMIGQLGTAGFVQRMDQYAAMLLEISRYRTPIVG